MLAMSAMPFPLSREDGPAVEWVTDERYWFWRGIRVPQWVIEEPSRITPAVMRSEVNEDVRRCMIDSGSGRRRLLEFGKPS